MKVSGQLMSEYERGTGASYRDSLTGLFNHGFFQLSLERELKRYERQEEAFTLALIDIDSFSFYNKRHGSLEGDRVLREISKLLEMNIREVDLAARYSGDELAAILIDCDAQAAAHTFERIRQAVEEMTGGEPTISVGLAACPRDAMEKETLINRAEEALLKAKTSGKNRVFFQEREIRSEEDNTPKILVVDDEPRNLKLFEGILSSHYEVLTALNGADALSIINKVDVDVILLDVMMPGMDGYEVCRLIKSREATRLIPVVIVTALDEMEDKVKAIEAGADDFITKSPVKMDLLARIKSLSRVKALNNDLASFENVLFSFANAIEAKDAYTQGHIQRVSSIGVGIGSQLALAPKEIKAIRIGGILHDVGKIGTSMEILNKPGPLTAEEMKIVQRHPEIGHKICLPLKKNLGAALDVIRHHHEKMDGSGYPDGLEGDEIPLEARVMAVADIYDALVSDRPYRKAMSKEMALEILRREGEEGKLDREVVGCLIEIYGGG